MPCDGEARRDGSDHADDAIALLGLMNVPGVGEAAIHRILQILEERETEPRFLPEFDAAELVAWELLADEQAQLFVSDEQRAWCEATGEELGRCGVRLIPITSPAYPDHLREKAPALAPPLLMVADNAALLDHPGIAFAGARGVSPAGADATRALVAGAVRNLFAVVSGGARGTDLVAHEAALERGGATVIVLAEGILSRRARGMAEQLRDANAVVVSALLPDQTWQAWSAMQRNRHILGLSDRLVVIEAADRGGTIAAGREALKREVPTWALDYADPPATAGGNQALIEEGASPIPVSADGDVAIPPELYADGGWVVKVVE